MGESIETLSGDPGLELPEFEAPPADPLPLLERWLQAADERGVREPRALALATADGEGRPSSRIVLLKQASPALVFAGSYESRKGRELAANPRAAGTLADSLAEGEEPLRRPTRWGGWRLDPDLVEFWHGSPDRLHRRLLYVKAEGGWRHQRLQP